eukprot:CAMPEP_0195307150 /NCGR_PEP_ID=MMETSP0707-20130614/37571_1 /TAXON_ID=33640 /ORGANISM="Asterionellopsis glacialis, Strain CCMP134" /LENGTH=432 /DNA_ID=CAMNT_0040371397 /DNA_START=240 /DNA_END=1538 /DNA_ORIENTATION=-
MNGIGEDDDTKKQLFFTTSDFVKRLNANVAELEGPEEVNKPRFELQKKLPDGSTRKAYDDELAAADMQTKIKQAAEQVSYLKTPEEKLEWATQQRQEGNKLYSAGKYKEAMDVYLSSLVAKPQEGGNSTVSTTNYEAVYSSEIVLPVLNNLAQASLQLCMSTNYEAVYSSEIVLPVLNNLAQASLQLCMYRKAETFCTIAIDEIMKQEEFIAMQSSQQQDRDSKEGRDTLKQMAKIYFRRGKSRRLRGNYEEAKKDIEEALCLIGTQNETSERKALDRELQKIEQAATMAEKNIKRQVKAMQKILGGTAEQQSSETIERDEDRACVEQNHDNLPMPVSTVESAAPHPDVSDHVGLYGDLRQRRAFSTLKAKPKKGRVESTAARDEDRSHVMNEDIELSYWQHYLLVIGTLAEKALEWIGDEETLAVDSDRDE